MKVKTLLILTIWIVTSCNETKSKPYPMEVKEPILEMVLFKVKKGIKPQEAEKALKKLNELLLIQEGFISRKTAVAKDGQFLDLVSWKDLESAEKASKEIMKNKEALEIFSIINDTTMTFNHFNIFNKYNN